MDNTKRKNEKGAALLLALGLLSLLLVMVMSFATTALLEREVADSASGGSVGRALAQSALNRCLSSIRYCIGKNTPDKNLDRFDRFVSWDGTGDPKDTTSLGSDQYYDKIAETMTTDWAGQPLYAYPSATPDRCPRWQYVKDADGRIIGRVAYAVLPDIGQMNVAGLRSSETPPARNGLDVAEFDISKIGFSNSAKIRVRANTKKSSVNSDSFFSFAEEFNNSDIEKIDYALAKKFFVFSKSYASADEEKYWMGDDKTKHEQYYHRFDLSRADWASMTENQLLGTPPPVAFYDTVNKGYPEIKTDATAAIPFLRVVADDKGTFDSLTDRRNQIAVNLIDYCDGDSVPTSVPPSSSWILSSAPAYTGNEKTDYIYEVGFQLGIIQPASAAYADSGFTISGNKATFAFGVLPVVKLVNLYESPTAVTYSFSNSLTKLTVKGQATCKIKVTYSIVAPPFTQTATWDFDAPVDVSQNNPALTGTLPIERTNTAPFIFSNGNDYAKGGFIVAGPTLDAAVIATDDAVKVHDSNAINVTGREFVSIDKVKLTEVSLTVGNMLLQQGVNGVDFVKGPLALTWSGSNELSSPFRLAVGSLQGKDPRQNLNPGDWDCTHVVANTDPAKVLSAETNTCDDAIPPDGSDPLYDDESLAGGDVSKLATAVITNAPIGNFDELGYIHRGAKWETLKLSNAGGDFNQDGYKYDTHDLNTAGTTYAEGDGGILNQVKIKFDNYIYGRINLNTKNEKVWQGLFSGITYEPSALSFDSDKLATKIVAILKDRNIWFDNRAYLLRPLKDIDSINTKTINLLDQAFTDAGITLLPKQKEEIIGKIMHLLKTEAYPEEFQVLIVAQSIKDFGGATEVQGAQLGRFDFTNTAPSINDEITSTVKYLARVRRDGKTLTIVNLQYIREADEK